MKFAQVTIKKSEVADDITEKAIIFGNEALNSTSVDKVSTSSYLLNNLLLTIVETPFQ